MGRPEPGLTPVRLPPTVAPMGKFGRWAAVLAALGGLIVVGLGMTRASALERLLTEAGPGGAPLMITAKPGASTRSLSRALCRPDLVRDPELFCRYLKQLHPPTPVPEGVYALSPDEPPLTLLSKLEGGDIEQRSLSIEAGQDLHEIAGAFVAAGLLKAPQDILRVARSPRWLKAQHIREESAAGYLWPGIYQLPLGRPARALLAPAAEAGRAAYKELAAAARAEGAPRHKRRRVLRVASIIQAASIPKTEWRRFSAVLWGRLSRGEPLNSKTVRARAAAEGWTPPASGLPRRPLCQPGPQALDAALRPDERAAAWMVERNNGSHVFCADRACYLRELARWRSDAPRDGALP